MAFPSSPVNGQTTTVNGITYTYNSAKTAWLRISTTGANLTASTLSLTSATPAISTTSGALLVAGGAGIQGALYVGSALTAQSDINANGNLIVAQNAILQTILTPSGTNANLVIDPDGTGDVVLASGTTLWLTDTSPATNTTSGALIVAGGAGISGNVYAGNVITNGNVVAKSFVYTNGTTVPSYGKIVASAIIFGG